MTVNIIKNIIPGSFMHRLNEGLKPSGEFCLFCGGEKNEFISPVTERIKLLDCDCERDYEMLKDFLDANKEWLNNSDNLPTNIINYKKSGAPDYSEQHLNFVIKARATFVSLQDTREENRSRCAS